MRVMAFGILLAVMLTLTLGSSVVFATNPSPNSIHVDPSNSPAVTMNEDPGGEQPPPHITIETPHGVIEPTL